MIRAQFTGVAILAALVFFPMPRTVRASTDSLSQQLDSLALPANEAPVSISKEALYAVQTRYSPLKDRSEFDLGMSHVLLGDDLISTNEVGLGYRFHLSDRLSLEIAGTKVFNSLSSAGDRLLDQQGLLPDSSYAKYRADLNATYNVFYGKFRLSMNQVFYFDQYVTLGAGVVGLQTGRQGAAMGEAGFAFWIGRKAAIRLGMSDWIYHARRVLSSGTQNDLSGHLEVGYLLGGER